MCLIRKPTRSLSFVLPCLELESASWNLSDREEKYPVQSAEGAGFLVDFDYVYLWWLGDANLMFLGQAKVEM